ncbi:MAG TPA: tetratricopeptide repeat protein [Nitrospirota bacterium]|nr:tetratricopeptide repeat protein [Nitrospirota bacterium]
MAFILLISALAAGGCDFVDRSASNDYEAATKRWNAGEYQAAVQLYFKLVKDHPSSPKAVEALYWAGVTQFLYLGETDKALQTLRLLLKTYPRKERAPYAQWYIAQIYELGYSDYGRAIEEYHKAASYTNREVREKSLYSVAECLFRTGKIEEAREIWTQQVAEFPNGQQSRLAYFRLGTAAFSRGELDLSEQYYRRALENNEEKELVIKAKFALAECLELGDRLKEALALYKDLEPVYPNSEAIQIKIKALENRIQKKSY